MGFETAPISTSLIFAPREVQNLENMTVNPFFQRLTLLTGPEAAAALEKCKVTVVGLGGVGSWAAEALVRSGIGHITLIDPDKVRPSNINRQVPATSSTIGRLKVDVLEEHLKDVNPSCEVRAFPHVFSKETAGCFDIPMADYIIDAIDSLKCKLDLIEAAIGAGKVFFSSMGMARKLDPTLIRTADIWKTSGCPLARDVRQGLRKRGIYHHFTAVYSPEQVHEWQGPALTEDQEEGEVTDKEKLKVLGSAVTVTAAAGMVLASLVIQDVCMRQVIHSG